MQYATGVKCLGYASYMLNALINFFGFSPVFLAIPTTVYPSVNIFPIRAFYITITCFSTPSTSPTTAGGRRPATPSSPRRQRGRRRVTIAPRSPRPTASDCTPLACLPAGNEDARWRTGCASERAPDVPRARCAACGSSTGRSRCSTENGTLLAYRRHCNPRRAAPFTQGTYEHGGGDLPVARRPVPRRRRRPAHPARRRPPARRLSLRVRDGVIETRSRGLADRDRRPSACATAEGPLPGLIGPL